MMKLQKYLLYDEGRGRGESEWRGGRESEWRGRGESEWRGGGESEWRGGGERVREEWIKEVKQRKYRE